MHNRIKLYALRTVLMGAGKIISSAFHRPVEVNQKADGSPVTEVDRAVDAFLMGSSTLPR